MNPLSWRRRQDRPLNDEPTECIRIPADAIEEMFAAARAAQPREACGVLAARPGGEAETIRAENSAESRFEFRVAGDEMKRIETAMKAAGQQAVGFWHSHVLGAAEPSAADTSEAAPGSLQLIVSLKEMDVRAFRIDRSGGSTGVAIETS